MTQSNPPTDQGPWDVFISYAHKDDEDSNGWISSFVAELIAEHARFIGGQNSSLKRKLNPFFDTNSLITGDYWRNRLAYGIAHSRLFLAFLSPKYFASEWCRKEWRAWMEAEIAQHILTAGVRPIYIVQVPGLTGQNTLSDHDLAQKIADLSNLPEPDRSKIAADAFPVIKHLRNRQLNHNQPFFDVQSFYNAGQDALRREDIRKILDQLARDIDHHSERLAIADASRSTVPAYNKRFTGRLDELLRLREQLIKDDRTGVIYGINGLGGMGKTELAYAYAQAFASDYPAGRFIIRCESKSTLQDAILSQFNFTTLFNDQITDEERKIPDVHFAAILRCLHNRMTQQGHLHLHLLLVLDNVTDFALLTHDQTQSLTALGPTLHLLATTRLIPPAAQDNWLSLNQLPDADALELLEKFRPIPPDQHDAALRIVKRLGGFTLAIELVAAHLAEHPDISCAKLADIIGLEDLENQSILESADMQKIRYTQDRRLSAVLKPTLDSLTPEQRRAMEYASLLPPDPLPLPWLKTLVTADFPNLAQPSRLTNPWPDLIRRLEKLTLLTRQEEDSPDPRLMRVHRLVQEVVQKGLSDSEKSVLQQRVNELIQSRLAEINEDTIAANFRWELIPLEAMAWLWVEQQHPGAAWLCNETGFHLRRLALNGPAEQLYRCSLSINEASFGKNHPNVAKSLCNLAQLLHATNRLSDAEPLMRRALSINEASFGKDHPDVSTYLNNLAMLLQDTNRLSEAEPLMRRALAIDETIFGNDHPKVATELNNLALLLQTTNRLSEAEPLMRRALAIDEASLGKDHPDVARNLNSLAGLLQATNRLSEAEPLMRRALAIDEASFGKNHPDVARDLSNLAQLLKATNRLSDAEPIMRRALAIDEASFGKDHPVVARDLSNLAQLLKATNRLSEAEPIMRRALAIDEASFGKNHPNVARDLSNLALLLKANNRLYEAEPLMRRALTIDEASFGKNHPNVARDLSNLAQLLQATNRLSDAEPPMRRALTIDEVSFGKDHPNVAIDLNNLAGLFNATNRLSDAEPLLRRALGVLANFQSQTGHQHPNFQAGLQNYRILLQNLNYSESSIAKKLKPFLHS